MQTARRRATSHVRSPSSSPERTHQKIAHINFNSLLPFAVTSSSLQLLMLPCHTLTVSHSSYSINSVHVAIPIPILSFSTSTTTVSIEITGTSHLHQPTSSHPRQSAVLNITIPPRANCTVKPRTHFRLCARPLPIPVALQHLRLHFLRRHFASPSHSTPVLVLSRPPVAPAHPHTPNSSSCPTHLGHHNHHLHPHRTLPTRTTHSSPP